MVDSDLNYNNPVVQLKVDRSKANSLGVTMKDIGDTLAVLVGENYINRFGMDGRSYDVIPQSLREHFAGGPGALTSRAPARSAAVEHGVGVDGRGPNKLTQFNQLNAATFRPFPCRA